MNVQLFGTGAADWGEYNPCLQVFTMRKSLNSIIDITQYLH